MPRHRSHSIEFKRQVAQEFVAGETLHGLAKRHDISRNLIRVWVVKFEAGAFDDDARAADLIQEYEARIAALERMVGRQALEIEFLKGALKTHHGGATRLCPSLPAPRPVHRARMSADGHPAFDLLWTRPRLQPTTARSSSRLRSAHRVTKYMLAIRSLNLAFTIIA